MKFGKLFKKQMVPEWIEAYMDYGGLKRILREISSYKQSKQLGTSYRELQQRALHRSFSGLLCQPRHTDTAGDDEDTVIIVDTVQQDDSRNFYRTNFLRKFEGGGEIEETFFRKLDEELNKVDIFYRDKVDEVVHEAALLDKQMDALIALRIKVQKPCVDNQNLEKHPSDTVMTDTPESTTRIPGENIEMVNGIDRTAISEEQAFNVVADSVPVFCYDYGHEGENSTGNKQDLHEILERVKIKNSLESPISTLKGVFGDSKNEEPSFKKGLRKAEEQLRLVFVEFYHTLRLLKEYSFINLLAFSKIMKKYEKIASRKVSRNYMKIVDNSFIGSSDEVTRLMARVEVTFVKYFSNADRREGMKCLRPKVKRERHRVTFFSGFFSGCSIALIIAVVFKIENRKIMKKNYGILYMTNIIPLYSLFGYIILHILMYAANIYFWRRYRVNYTFIFGFKQGTEMGYREVFLVGTGLAVLALICFLVNLQLDMGWRIKDHKTLSEAMPLSLVAIVLVILFCPLNIIYRSSRLFFIRSLTRCVFAPLYKVRLPDFFLADHLTSQVQAIRSFELFICYYGLGEYMQRHKKCHKHGVYNVFYFVVAVIPYWLRFLQCIRRLCEEKDSIHGYNALKYLLTIIAVVIRTAFELKKGRKWMILALISSGIATVMNTFWDIIIDWGLLRRHSKNAYLRDKLLVPRKSVYFAAMVLNVILRVAWMQLVLEFNMRSLQKIAVLTITSCLEIVRRGVWSFFRLENEHLNNVGKYRAFKSVPHPFDYYDDDETDKDD